MSKPQLLVPSRVELPRQQPAAAAESDTPLEIGRLVRKYLLLALALTALGMGLGFAVLLRETPVYRAEMLLEVNPINEAYLRSSLDPLSGNMDPNAINVATQIRLLQSGPAATQVWQSMVAEPPPPPVPADILARLRSRISRHPHTAIGQLRAAGMAVDTFEARPVSGTRLIELNSESTHPQIAAEFLNRVAEAFVEESDRNRFQSSERTTQWLKNQFEEIKAKLEGAEGRLQGFVQRYGTDFAVSRGTPANTSTTQSDAELKSLQADLAASNADLVSKQARYQAAGLGDIEDLPEVMDDAVLKDIERKLAGVRDDRRALDRIYKPDYYKVQQSEAEEQELITARKARAQAIVGRLKSDFDAALLKQKMLNAEYAAKGQSVISQAGLVTEYDSLKRDVDTLQTSYDMLSQRLSQTSAATNLPVGLIRIVEKSSPPSAPYTPQPAVTMGLGGLGGFALALIVGFFREGSDKTIRVPGTARGILDLPELGVIPRAGRLIQNSGLGSRPANGLRSRLLSAGRSNPRVVWTADRGSQNAG